MSDVVEEATMKLPIIAICIIGTVFLLSCGQNGEITDWTEYDEVPIESLNPPPAPGSEALQPAPPLLPPEILDTVTNDDQEEPPEIPAIAEEETTGGNDVQETEVADEETQEEEDQAEKEVEEPEGASTPPISKDDPPWSCMTINEAPWWVMHQLTGGLTAYTRLVNAGQQRETTANGVQLYIKWIKTGQTDVIMETKYFTGNPQTTGARHLFDPDNVVITYHNLSYSDPVFGPVVIDGRLACNGKTLFYSDTMTFYRQHECNNEGGYSGHLTINFQGEDHTIDLNVNRMYSGTENTPEYYSYSGKLYINGNRHLINSMSDIPADVAKCLGL